jgi:retron-type reverse transcriptase
MFIQTDQICIKFYLRKLIPTRVNGMKPKEYNDTKQVNTGFPKVSNRHGNGGSIVPINPILLRKRFIREVSQRKYSTNSNANPKDGVNKKLNIIKLENNKFTGLYKQMTDIDFLSFCYDRIKSKPGNMTIGSDYYTLDGMSKPIIENISKNLRDDSFQFKPARRVMIPKKNGKSRALAIASPRDKIVQEGMRLLLEDIFEPFLLDSSHGFRPSRSCHTALKSISK